VTTECLLVHNAGVLSYSIAHLLIAG
jgi:hypothetical protein